MPNSVISNETIINSTTVDEKICVFIELAVALQVNLDKAIGIIQDEATKHHYYVDNRSELEIARGEQPVMVRVMTFLDGGILLRAYVWTLNPTDAFDLKCDLNKSIKERFDKENIALANMQYQVLTKNS
jgi:small-conductance mechanosensitive channel